MPFGGLADGAASVVMEIVEASSSSSPKPVCPVVRVGVVYGIVGVVGVVFGIVGVVLVLLGVVVVSMHGLTNATKVCTLFVSAIVM